jgi:hypothetical protein
MNTFRLPAQLRSRRSVLYITAIHLHLTLVRSGFRRVSCVIPRPFAFSESCVGVGKKDVATLGVVQQASCRLASRAHCSLCSESWVGVSKKCAGLCCTGLRSVRLGSVGLGHVLIAFFSCCKWNERTCGFISVCLSAWLSVRMFQLQKRWTDLDEILYGRYAIGIYPRIVLFNLLQSVILTWRTKRLVRWNRH